jgi:predicted transcriptional regulator of viral defense system
MTPLVDKILRHIPYDTVSDVEIALLLPGTADSRRGQVKRALASGQLQRLRRGLYALAPHYRRRELHPFAVACRMVSPSYISLESALSYHGCIPEGVYTTTAACLGRGHDLHNALGTFAYQPVPERVFMQEVERVEEGSQIFLIATPLKALCDYVYVKRLKWHSVEPLVESLRIDPDDLNFTEQEFDDLRATYGSARVLRFLNGLWKDLKK